MDPNLFNLRKDAIDEEEEDNQMENEENSKNTKAKRKRRSKNEKDGRNFNCEVCGKCYLSQPALTNHNKTKHHLNDPEFKRSRGRPRKTISNPNTEKDTLRFRNFFENNIRHISAGESNNFDELSNSVFEEMFANYKEKLFPNVSTKHDHNLFKNLMKRYQMVNDAVCEGLEIEGKKCADEIFADYVVGSFNQVNRNYFVFLLKFVILFRECLNGLKTREGANEYSQEHGADSAPDLCNEFITDFMENNDNFNIDPNELIEIIQHFCFWLYENSHTTSRLTLLS